MAKSESRFDTVIIGAGISGLCAARQLQRNGQKVLVLEARDRVGGRTYTLKDEEFGAVDLGGAYVGPTQNRVYRICEELKLELYTINESNHTVMDLKSCYAKYKGEIPSFWNPFKILDLNHFIRQFDRMAKRVPCQAPWSAKEAQEWDSMTVAEFIDKLLWTRSAKELATILMRALLCAEPREISLLFALWYVHSGGGVRRISSITNGAQERKIIGGSQQISEGLARLIGKDNVRLNTTVVQISQDDNGVIVRDISGNTYKAKYVVSAVPVALLNRIHFNPPLPWIKSQMLQRMPMGSIIKTVMFYKKNFWRRQDLNGIAMSSDGICCYCIDDTKPAGVNPGIMGFILADRARELAQTTPEARKQALCEHYAWVFNSDEFLHPIGYREYNWMEDPYSGGCYTSVLPPNVLTRYARCVSEPVGRVYFAGTETATIWAGYMDGAIQAGERAANQILYDDGQISFHEIEREEPESRKYPAKPVPFSYIEYYAPSNSAVLRFSIMALLGFAGVSIYVFFFSWKGALFWRWFKWKNDLDDYDMKNLSKYFRIPSKLYKHVKHS